MGQLSSQLLAELQAGHKSAFPVCAITLPTGSGYRVASVPISVAGVGQYNGKVIRWAPYRRSLSDRDGSLQLSTAGVTFEDVDRTFSSAVASAGIEAMRGSAFGFAIGSANVAVGNWFNLFVGTVDTVRMDSPFVWTVTAQSNQQQLREGKFPKTPLLQGDFPNVQDQAIYAFRVPIIYGVHDSRGSGDHGSVPCLYVDTLGFRYLVSHGWVTVDRVYTNGTLRTLTSDYTVEHETINGRLYTLVDFAPAGDQGDAVVTADVTGFESDGDGGGATLTGTDALAHLLTNFIYGDYQGGLWASTHSSINTTLFSAAQTILANLGAQKVSMRYGGAVEGVTGADAIASFCKSLRADGFQTGPGKLGLVWNSPFDTAVSHNDPNLLKFDRDELAPLQLEWDRSRLTTGVMTSFLFQPADGNYMQKVEVRDLSASEDVRASLDLAWSYRSLL